MLEEQKGEYQQTLSSFGDTSSDSEVMSIYFIHRPQRKELPMGGSPIIMGGSSQSELQAQLKGQPWKTNECLPRLLMSSSGFRPSSNRRTRKCPSSSSSRPARPSVPRSRAQKALDIEVDALDAADKQDDLEVDFSALEKALALAGMGLGDTGARPL